MPAIKRKYFNLQVRFIMGWVPRMFLIWRLYILKLNLTRCHVTHVRFCTSQRILWQLGNFLSGLNLLYFVNDDTRPTLHQAMTFLISSRHFSGKHQTCGIRCIWVEILGTGVSGRSLFVTRYSAVEAWSSQTKWPSQRGDKETNN